MSTVSAEPICSASESMLSWFIHTSPAALITTSPGFNPRTTSVVIVSVAPSSTIAAEPVSSFVLEAGRSASFGADSNTVSPVAASVMRAWNVPNASSAASAATSAARAAVSTGCGVAGSSTGVATGSA